MGPRRLSNARSNARLRGSVATSRPTRACSAILRAAGRRSNRRCWAHYDGRDIRSRLRGSDCMRCAPRMLSRDAPLSTSGPGRLFGGIAAHGMVPLDRPLTAGFGLVLGAMAHIVGWVIPRGGAQKLTDALVAHLRTLGGEVVADHRVTSLDELPPARAVLCDLSPRPLLRIAGARFPASCTGAASSDIGTGWVSSKSIGHSTRRFHGERPSVRVHPPSTCAGTWRNWRGRNRTRGRASRRSGRSCCSCSRHSLIRRVRRREAHGVGLLSRAERLDGRHAATHRSADRALRARVPRPRPGALGRCRPPTSKRTMRIWSAAISDRESSTCASSSPGRRGAPTRRRCAASISAPRRRRQVSASTACADTSRRSARSPMPASDDPLRAFD